MDIYSTGIPQGYNNIVDLGLIRVHSCPFFLLLVRLDLYMSKMAEGNIRDIEVMFPASLVRQCSGLGIDIGESWRERERERERVSHGEREREREREREERA